ncbi:MAG TPA: ATP-dependent DNA helicase [Caldithrix abyssi]|uniref:DNA 5'-3' helicase n=1 Tax=Caldithrix abyssi TaxID=187145 RepID=A0A7V4U2I1_CALAY|nr:ATP-dependent DNA helicase [Caldithrix abyssi]
MAVRIEDQTIYLGVRDLLQPVYRQQMLSSFPLPQRGMLGREAQTRVQKQKERRFGLFHSEYAVSRSYAYEGYTFHIYGRIDGVYNLKNRVEIEEIKSVILQAVEFRRLKIEQYPEFIEQVLFYAYLLQDELQGKEVAAYLVLVNLINDARRTFPVDYNRLQVERLLFRRFAHILANLQREQQERLRREDELKKIRFTLPEKRPQQKKMMRAVASSVEQKRHLLVSAPTGTGKTAAALFPAIQYAYSRGKKLFFVTSKTTQQAIVQETMYPLLEQGLDFHTVYLRAAEKMCANKVFFCHEAFCPYIADYRDRFLQSNLQAELEAHTALLPDRIYDAAAAHTLCPFEVSLDMSLSADLIIGDYNYVFDPGVYLRRLFARKDYSDWILIIDEAHNLYDRGMGYLSPEIRREQVQNLIGLYEDKETKVYQKLLQGLKEIMRLLDSLELEGDIHFAGQQYFKVELNTRQWEEAFLLYEAAFVRYLIHNVKKRIVLMEDPAEKLYYVLRRFVQIARLKERAFVPFYDAAGILKIQCCDPSDYLGRRMEGFHSVIAMSATLDPMPFYLDVLGFNAERSDVLQLDSPFPAENRKIIIVPGVSTRYKDRMQNYPKIAEIIKNTVRQRKGNYLVFFPSYDFVQNVNLFLGDLNQKKILQKPSMKEEDREQVLLELKRGNEPVLLLAVMGGIFSEGIDYSGDMAIGVIVVSPALPKISYERELLREYYDEKQDQGMEYAYIYPGMNKVIQAVGRLIRSATDKGVVLLIGERFARDEYNLLLPDYWLHGSGDVEITNEYKEAIRSFWNRLDNT